MEDFKTVPSQLINKLIKAPPSFALSKMLNRFSSNSNSLCLEGALTIMSSLWNLEWWNSLPEDIQAIVNDSWEEAAALYKISHYNIEAWWLEEAQNPPYNMTVYYPTAEELAEFKAAMSPVFDWARDEYGSEYVDMLLDYAK